MADPRLGSIGPRGERGERGERGHRGNDGATGPTGPAAASSGGLLKFSGVVVGEGATPEVAFLPDIGDGFNVVSDAIEYPVAVDRTIVNFATNLQPVALPLGGTLVIDVLQNGVPIPGFTITYTGPASGIQSVVAGPVTFSGAPTPDTLDVRVTATGFTGPRFISATIGIV